MVLACKRASNVGQLQRVCAGQTYCTAVLGPIKHLVVSSAKEEAIKTKEAAHEGCMSC